MERKFWRLAGIGLGLVLVAILPILITSPYHLRLANLIGINLLLVLGLNFILGYTGLLSFAQVGFFLIGAYTCAILSADYGWSFWIALGVGGLFAAASAWLIGMPTLRLRGHYFAFATFAFAEIMRLVATNWGGLTHGASGLVGIPVPALGGLEFDDDFSYFYLILVFVALGLFVSWRIERSKIGRALFAIRESELAAEAMGIETHKAKQQAFILSAIFAGVAGGLYGPLNSVISPDVFSFDVSVIVLIGLLLGGSGTISGAILGTILITLLPEWLRFLQEYYMIIYGAGVVLLMIFLPEGIVGAAKRFRSVQAAPAGAPMPGKPLPKVMTMISK